MVFAFVALFEVLKYGDGI